MIEAIRARSHPSTSPGSADSGNSADRPTMAPERPSGGGVESDDSMFGEATGGQIDPLDVNVPGSEHEALPQSETVYYWKRSENCLARGSEP
jgi:hypothetical protein